ncbi:MAG: hypothetical protein ACTSUJ_02025 [Candidatus Njordarchaeales archaeon]
MKPLLIPFASTLQERGVNIITLNYMEKLRGLYEESLPIITSIRDLEEYQDEIKNYPLIFALACTGGTSKLIVALERFGKPIVILSHGKQNSLPSALEALYMLRARNHPAILIHGLSQSSLETLQKISLIGEALHDIANSKILLIGGSKEWLESENYDLDNFSKLFGAEIIYEEIEGFIELVQKADSSRELIEHFKKFSKTEIRDEDIKESSKMYNAARNLLKKHNAEIFGIRCFPIIMRTKITPCLTVSKLIDEGIPAACEADLSAAILIALLMKITKRPVFMGNTVDINDNEITFAHCTVATGFIEKAILRKHFETEWSVSVAGIISENKTVTFARFSHDFRRLMAGKGIISKGSPWSEEFCRTQLKVIVEGDPSKITREPVGNHFVIAEGDYIRELELLSELLGIRFEKI